MSPATHGFGPAPLSPLEIASGVPIGVDPGAPHPDEHGDADPLAALERAAARALRRPPCVVSFSGGRDSSAILAVAVRVARREGLQPPVPVTLRIRDSPAADESDWQELVIRHLGVEDWLRLDVTDELDLVGPVATAMLQRHGLVWPPNTHFHQPILEHAHGGAILTGIDGDGIFGSWRWQHFANALGRRRRPEMRDMLRGTVALGPKALRRSVDRRRSSTTLPWLRPEAMSRLRRAWAADAAGEPLAWDRFLDWFSRRRALRMVTSNFGTLAEAADVHDVHPFTDPGFLVALGRSGGATGYAGRTDIMGALFSELLPRVVLERPSKALVDDAMWNRHSRAFIDEWIPNVDEHGLVDVDALRREWTRPRPHAATSTLLQAAWLSGQERAT